MSPVVHSAGRPCDRCIVSQLRLIAHHEVVGVRRAGSKLVYYPTWKNGPFWECFDLAQDPREMRNLALDPRRGSEVTALKNKLRALADFYRDAEVVRALESELKN